MDLLGLVISSNDISKFRGMVFNLPKWVLDLCPVVHLISEWRVLTVVPWEMDLQQYAFTKSIQVKNLLVVHLHEPTTWSTEKDGLKIILLSCIRNRSI